jgi:D-alanyl-D-alanine carboxypeptidase/D-alanyl-D-alanine-endopeptidase (penicillin-binding protein 4)
MRFALRAAGAVATFWACCAVAPMPFAQAQSVSPAPSATPSASLPFEAVPVIEEATPVPKPTLRASTVRPAAAGADWSASEIARLDEELDALLADSAAIRGAHVGVVAVDSRDGKTLYARHGDDEFQPASTLKLLVGSVSLERLGPTYRFRTIAYVKGVAGEPARREGDALVGSLVLRGGGDPLLSTHDLAGFAAAVSRLGIARIVSGSLAVDPSHFDRAPYPEGWVWDDFAQDYAPVVAATTIEENVIHLFARPRSDESGWLAVSAQPLRDVLRAAPESCAPSFDVVVISRARVLPAGSQSSLDVAREGNGCIDVIGGIPAGENGESIDAAVPSPEAYAYRIAAQQLGDAGIDPGMYRSASPPPWDFTTGSMPAGAPIVWSHLGPPLGSWLGPRFWIPSDNLAAELLLKEIGCGAGGEPGTTAKGIAFERQFLRAIGVDPKTVTLADGSGLSQYDRITPRDLVAILQHDWNGPHRDLVLDSLPIGGARGTIEGIAGTPVAGRVVAKTGSMSHVRGLAGYLATERHGAVTFAFNVDDWNGDNAALAALRANALARIAAM